MRSSRTVRQRLGPLVEWVPLDGRVTGRFYAAGVAIAAAAVLLTAARLHPDGHGLGTHRQFGLPPCGFVTLTGLPCPTCGMTTAFACTVHGHWLAALHAQVAGFVLAVGTALAGALAIVTVIRGRRPAVNWYRVNPLHVLWWGTALLVGSWAVKLGVGLLDGSLPAR